MRGFFAAALAYAALAAAYLCLSGAPLRVHALSLALLALAVFVPVACAGQISCWRYRLAVCCLCALASMVAWDASAHYVIVKQEPFSVLLEKPWLYLAGGGMLALLSYGISWIAFPRNRMLRSANRL